MANHLEQHCAIVDLENRLLLKFSNRKPTDALQAPT